jgi:hypothetical protein
MLTMVEADRLSGMKVEVSPIRYVTKSSTFPDVPFPPIINTQTLLNHNTTYSAHDVITHLNLPAPDAQHADPASHRLHRRGRWLLLPDPRNR